MNIYIYIYYVNIANKTKELAEHRQHRSDSQAFHLLRPNHHSLIPAPDPRAIWSRHPRSEHHFRFCSTSWDFLSTSYVKISQNKSNKSKMLVLCGKALLQGTVLSPDLWQLASWCQLTHWLSRGVPTLPSLPVASTLEWSGRQATSRTLQLLVGQRIACDLYI